MPSVRQIVFVLVTELQMDVVQELIHVRQLQYLLISHHEHQIKLIIELVFERETAVVVRVGSRALLRNVKHKSCHVTAKTHLEDNAADQRVHGGREDLAGRLEAPQHDAPFAENREEVQHVSNTFHASCRKIKCQR